MKMLETANLFDLSCMGGDFLAEFRYPWEVLCRIGEYILSVGPELEKSGYRRIAENVWVSPDAKIAGTAFIGGPCIIGPGAEIRHSAFIRTNAFIGAGAVIGNSTEIKNAFILDGAELPHYNYAGDSVIGRKAHMGAGAITSNVKGDKSPVAIKWDGGSIQTGRKKVGAMLGDHAEIGCGSVLNPGTVIGRGTQVYPLSSVRGFVPENNIYKSAEMICPKLSERKDL